MSIIADLHIHGRFSRATSKTLDIKNLEKFAKIKGVGLLGTGDFTHPAWSAELKKELEESDGICRTKTGFPFVLQTELSLMYTQDGKGRRVHLIVLAPNFSVVGQLTEALKKKGRVDYDGRPIFNLSCIEFMDMALSISRDIEIIPAHAWTPYFGILGSKSGFDSVEQCFRDRAKHVHALETGLSCYDKKTEVLTDGGWKNISEVKYANKVCTLNPDTGKIEFQYPNKVFTYAYKGKMYRLKTKRVDLLVTPNHKLYVSTCDFRNPKPFFLKEAELLFGKSKQFKKDGSWQGKDERYFTLPSVKVRHGSKYYSGFRIKKQKKLPIKAWLKFFGFWIAEGWTNYGGKGDYNICVCNLDIPLLNKIKQILKSFGYNVYHNKKAGVIRVRDYQLFYYLKQFGKCYDKFIPPEIKCLSKGLLEIFLRYYIKGDGHVYGRTGMGLSATTTSMHLRDDLQEIALKVGMSAYYKLHNKKGTAFISPSQKKIYKQRNDSWNVYFIRQNKHTVIPSSIKRYNHTEKWDDFEGEVYCVSVPNKVIYIRRNGIPVWCGNSDPPMNRRLSILDSYRMVSFSDLHSYWPWRLGREATIFDIELSYRNLIGAIRTGKGLVGTVEVDPAYGKYHYDGHRACGVCLSPAESLKLKNICPKCRKELTIGVKHRVEQLADRPEGFMPEKHPAYYQLIPLSELIAGLYGKPVGSKKTWEVYNQLIKEFGTEFKILLEATPEQLEKAVGSKLAETIIKNRMQQIKVMPGYDGEYGVPVFDGTASSPELPKQRVRQTGLEDFG